MNYTLFFAILNLLLLSRLSFTLRDQGISDNRDLIKMASIPLFILPFLGFNLSWFLLAGYFLLLPLITYFLERNKSRLNQNRMRMLALNIVIIALLTSSLFNLQLSNWVLDAEVSLLHFFLPDEIMNTINWLRIHAILFGFLMILNEINIIIRLILEKLNLSPLSNIQPEIDEEQFQTGRVIGFLERIFVFLFVLLNQYTAIGFIIAAKGIVRYPDFGKKSFTEYILIGTLLSALFAILMAYIVMIFV